jgi:lipopolysaccharide export system permease protein
MFILVMQFFWVYIDDLMGKGIEVWVIIKLLFYVSASLIPLALPLAILLSSIMTFGNLSENNELTALKSSGLSLYRIIRPLFVLVLIIAIGTFYFANYVIPVANLKWHTLIFDIQNTKISTVITPGVYSTELEGYAIKVDEGEGNQFKGVLIHDHTVPNQLKTIRAEEGKIYKSENGKYLFFEMKNGSVLEELEPQTPKYSLDGKAHSAHKNHSARHSKFELATYKIDLSGFDMEHSEEEMFKNKHEMLNVFQIDTAMDSIKRHGKKIVDNFVSNIKNTHPYLASIGYHENSKIKKDDESRDKAETPSGTVQYKSLTYNQKVAAINKAKSTIRNRKRNIENQEKFIGAMEEDMDNYMIEFNRKFALTVAIVILFFIGAPLGAIVRKGGFGAPVVIAALLFMIYFVLISIGDNLAKSNTVSPFVGMWFASFVLAPIAFFIMRAAAKDLPISSMDYWRKLFKRSKA